MRKVLVALILVFSIGAVSWYVLSPLKKTSEVGTVPSRSEALRFSKKLSELSSPATHSSRKTLEFTEREIDSYVYYDLSQYFPRGLHEVRIKLLDDSIAAQARINFDEIQAGGNTGKNPLLNALLKGEHTVQVNGKVKAQNKVGSYDIVGLLIDQNEIPKPLVDLLITKLVLPKYPIAKPNTNFELPYEINKIDVREGKLVIYQGSE
jgi:hypothetical protein